MIKKRGKINYSSIFEEFNLNLRGEVCKSIQTLPEDISEVKLSHLFLLSEIYKIHFR